MLADKNQNAPLAAPRRKRTLSASIRRTQSGQSVIVAVIVLFLLLFLGAIFIALIARNL